MVAPDRLEIVDDPGEGHALEAGPGDEGLERDPVLAAADEGQVEGPRPPRVGGEHAQQRVLRLVAQLEATDAGQPQRAARRLGPGQRAVRAGVGRVADDDGARKRGADLVLGQAPAVLGDEGDEPGAGEHPGDRVAGGVGRPVELGRLVAEQRVGQAQPRAEARDVRGREVLALGDQDDVRAPREQAARRGRGLAAHGVVGHPPGRHGGRQREEAIGGVAAEVEEAHAGPAQRRGLGIALVGPRAQHVDRVALLAQRERRAVPELLAAAPMRDRAADRDPEGHGGQGYGG